MATPDLAGKLVEKKRFVVFGLIDWIGSRPHHA